MIRGLYKLADKTFSKQGEVSEEVKAILLEGETVHCCYETGNDSVVFTDRRFISKDSRGKKTAIYTVPYKSVNVYMTETPGAIDNSASIILWTNNEQIKINLSKDIDIRELDKIIAKTIV